MRFIKTIIYLTNVPQFGLQSSYHNAKSSPAENNRNCAQLSYDKVAESHQDISTGLAYYFQRLFLRFEQTSSLWLNGVKGVLHSFISACRTVLHIHWRWTQHGTSHCAKSDQTIQWKWFAFMNTALVSLCGKLRNFTLDIPLWVIKWPKSETWLVLIGFFCSSFHSQNFYEDISLI